MRRGTSGGQEENRLQPLGKFSLRTGMWYLAGTTGWWGRLDLL